MTLQTEMDEDRRLLMDLDNNVYQLVVTHSRPEGNSLFYAEFEKEVLMFALPKGHRYARRKSVSFSEMNGENMLLMPDIGFWSFVRGRMPDTRFLEQSDRYSFNELLQASSLPSFTTNLAEKYTEVPSGRVHVSISDEDATVTYYLACKREKKAAFSALFSSI